MRQKGRTGEDLTSGGSGGIKTGMYVPVGTRVNCTVSILHGDAVRTQDDTVRIYGYTVRIVPSAVPCPYTGTGCDASVGKYLGICCLPCGSDQ